MSAPNKADQSVNRLTDIVVEEVSLVDRAANKQRFLIVKRSNDMDETTTDAAATAADETEDVQDLAADTGDEESAGDAGAADGSSGDDTPLASALAALEGLTEAVEILATASGDAANPRLAELAGEIGAVSQRLASLAGAPGADSEPGASEGGAGQDGQAGATDGGPLASAVASVRETLARVSAAIEAAGKGTEGGAAAAGAQDDAGDAGGNSDDGVATQLAALVTELRTLTGTVQEQQQRLARLEKRFGLPNSAPSGERRAKPDDEDVGWPLDLNRPFDRESVDKATSFHDL